MRDIAWYCLNLYWGVLVVLGFTALGIILSCPAPREAVTDQGEMYPLNPCIVVEGLYTNNELWEWAPDHGWGFDLDTGDVFRLEER
ncbi:hypothetical protein LCGC14_2813380 [marine sediment metagenome]|uniref:Uncharacterized protein n=1 Tax=marine sediment metagenome TaxID=412755 RepID=A0A0F8Z628_9ZZZZ